jgi:lipid-A-disaccharide synthase
MEKIKNILIVAGEASSDLHAANLVREIKNINPNINFSGLGGKRLKIEGVNLYYDIVELAVVGLFEVLKNYPKFKKIFDNLLKEVDLNKPELAILVDYPGFNLRLAKELKKRNIPIVYYISPQVWAWGRNRIKTIRDCVERIIVFFKFEEEFYQKEGIAVSFFGHPLLDLVKPTAKLNLNPTQYTIALLPGSREKEVKNILPIMLDTADLLYKEITNIKFLILRSPTVKEELFKEILSRYKLPTYILTDMTYDGLAASDFAMVASGTATLETAISLIPMVVMYKVSFLSWLYLRTAIKVPYIGMVNLIANKKIVPEFIQYGARPKKIASYIKDTLTNPKELDRIRKLLLEVKSRLGENQASQKAALLIVDLLEKHENKPH